MDKEVTRVFPGVPSPVRVIFYSSASNGRAGVILMSATGREIGQASMMAPLGLYGATGVYRLTGREGPEIVLLASVGAKTSEARIYQFRAGRLSQIFEWSGWRFRIVRLRGRPVIAVTPYQYGSLTQLLVWGNGKFVDESDRFPKFYDGEIASETRVLGESGLPAYVYSQACDLSARALVYGGRYSAARRLCEHALDVVEHSAGVIPSVIGGTSGVLEADRKAAAGKIERVLGAIAGAKRTGARRLLPNL